METMSLACYESLIQRESTLSDFAGNQALYEFILERELAWKDAIDALTARYGWRTEEYED